MSKPVLVHLDCPQTLLGPTLVWSQAGMQRAMLILEYFPGILLVSKDIFDWSAVSCKASLDCCMRFSPARQGSAAAGTRPAAQPWRCSAPLAAHGPPGSSQGHAAAALRLKSQCRPGEPAPLGASAAAADWPDQRALHKRGTLLSILRAPVAAAACVNMTPCLQSCEHLHTSMRIDLSTCSKLMHPGNIVIRRGRNAYMVVAAKAQAMPGVQTRLLLG